MTTLIGESARAYARTPPNALRIPDPAMVERWKEDARLVLGAEEIDTFLWILFTRALPQGHWYDVSPRDIANRNHVSDKTRRLISEREHALTVLSRRIRLSICTMAQSLEHRSERDSILEEMKLFAGDFVYALPQAYHDFWLELMDFEDPNRATQRIAGLPSIQLIESAEFDYLCRGAALYDGKSRMPFSAVLNAMRECLNCDEETSVEAVTRCMDRLLHVMNWHKTAEHEAFAVEFGRYLSVHEKTWHDLIRPKSAKRALTASERGSNGAGSAKRRVPIDLSSSEETSQERLTNISPEPPLSLSQERLTNISPEPPLSLSQERPRVSVKQPLSPVSVGPMHAEMDAIVAPANSVRSQAEVSASEPTMAIPRSVPLSPADDAPMIVADCPRTKIVVEDSLAEDLFPAIRMSPARSGQFLQELLCGVCNRIRQEPRVSTKCGHVFCGACWDRWLEEHESCPLCRAKVRRENLVRILS